MIFLHLNTCYEIKFNERIILIYGFKNNVVKPISISIKTEKIVERSTVELKTTLSMY